MICLDKSIIRWDNCLQVFTREQVNIDRYACYRSFLADWFRCEKARDPRFSHRVFAGRAGFTSSALLPLILQGRRNLTDRYYEGFVRALRLSPREATVFRALVDLGNAKDDETRRACEAALRATRQGAARRVEAGRVKLFESWLHVAVHQALDCLRVSDDLGPLRDFLKPTPTLEELRGSIALLQRLGMVERDAHGVWKTSESNLLGDWRVGPWILRGFQEQMLDLGKTAHEHFPSGRLLSRTETLSVGVRAAERIQERVRLCLEEVVDIALADQDEPATVLQMNAQLFPLTEIRNP